MDKRFIWVIVAVVGIVSVFCCCLVLFTGGLSAFFLSANEVTESSRTVDTVEVEERELTVLPTIIPDDTQQGEPGSVPGQSESESAGPSSELITQMDQIQLEVESFRELPPAVVVDRKTLSAEELRTRVFEDFFEDYDEQEMFLDLVELDLLGLLDREFNLYELYIELYSEQIAGFYDDETTEMVVVQGEAFQGTERMTYAHEYTHALQDAAFDLDDGLGLNEENCQENGEYCAAVRALVEGDASLTELIWFQQFASEQDQQEVFDFYDGYESPVFDSAPVFLQEDFVFPYNQGFEFAQFLFEKGGYAAINDAYLNPPQSTEQILHPELYPQEEPIQVNLPDLTSVFDENWQDLGASTLGEWGWYLFFSRPDQINWAVDESTAQRAAAGWGGDRYTVYYQQETDQAVLISLSAWDSRNELIEFWDAFDQYGDQRWGLKQQDQTDQKTWQMENQVVMLKKTNDLVLWLTAPNMEILNLVTAEIQGF